MFLSLSHVLTLTLPTLDLRNEVTRVDTMRTVTDFLKVPDRSQEQLHCAFILADDRQVITHLLLTHIPHPIPCRVVTLFYMTRTASLCFHIGR